MEPYTEEIERHSIWEFRLTSRALSGSDAAMPPRPDPIQLASDLQVVEREAGSDSRSAGRWSRAELASAMGAEPETTWRAIPGRVTFPWPQGAQPSPPGGRVVVKRFDRVRSWLGRLGPDPARAEYDALMALFSLGLPVPEPILHARSPRLERSMVLMGEVPHRRSLRQAIAADPDPVHRARAEALRLAELAARLHGAGWYHRDLYLQHVVEREGDGELVLLDLGRARRERRPRARWFQKDLSALHLSGGEEYREALLGELLPEYFRLRALSPAALPAWERAIRRRSARVLARLPRHVDEGTREGAEGDGAPLG